ncbi:MAG: hypothetical protein QXW98_04615 [Candidatus Caldarchaeum sp.]
MPVSIDRQKLVDAIVDNQTVVRNSTNNRISVPRYIHSTGSVAVPAGTTSTTVIDPDTNDNYTIIVEVSWNTTVFITGKTATGFTINFGTAVPSGGRTIKWIKVRTI